jgi:hypothetical protein
MICCGSCIPIILKGKGKASPQDYEILASPLDFPGHFFLLGLERQG